MRVVDEHGRVGGRDALEAPGHGLAAIEAVLDGGPVDPERVRRARGRQRVLDLEVARQGQLDLAAAVGALDLDLTADEIEALDQLYRPRDVINDHVPEPMPRYLQGKSDG